MANNKKFIVKSGLISGGDISVTGGVSATTLGVTGEYTFPSADGTNGQVLITDGSGNISFASKFNDVVDDTTPQLGGTLDANGNNIDMGVNLITDAKVGQWDTAYGWGDHGAEGYLTAEVNDLTSAVTWANVPSANITEASVTQHQAALSITESQISDFGSYETAFSKNTGFNLNLGTTAGTVAEGDHVHPAGDITSGTFADARIAASNVTQHQASLSITESQISDFGSYEPAFSKNTGFNKNLGTTAGTVAEGNHVHATTDITSGTFADARIAASNVTQHQASLSITESQISDLQSYLTAESDTLDDVTGRGATTTNAISVGNITTSGYLRGPSSFTIDPAGHGDNTGTVIIAGNLQVDGTTTTINSTTVTIDDLNFVVAANSTSSAEADGAGISFGAHAGAATFTWSSGSSYLTANTVIEADGYKIDGQTGFIKADGTVDTSTYLTSYTETNDLTSAVTWANVPNANITESSVTQHQAALSITESQISDFGSYETAFSKNTGFNLNLGTTSGTVAEGNHTHAASAIVSGTFADARIAASNVTQHQASLSITESQISDFGTYETAFSKNTGFNLNLGTTAGTVAEGNHTHSTAAITSGTFADARIAESNVTQHQAALSITESQISDLQSYLTAESDTLDDVTGRGATTTNAISVGSVTIGDSSVSSATASTSSTTQTTVATLTAANFKAAKFIITATDTVAGEVHSTELLVVHDGTTAHATEYATVYTGSAELAEYDVTLSGASVYVQATAASSNATDYVVTQILSLTV